MGRIVSTNTESIALAATGMSALAVVAFKTRACSERQQSAILFEGLRSRSAAKGEKAPPSFGAEIRRARVS